MTLAIIFDLDGTLIDTPRGIVESFTVALQTMGLESIDPLAIRATIGLPLDVAFSNLLSVERDHQSVQQSIVLYQTSFRDIVLPKAKDLIFPGVAKGLEVLKSKGLLLAVATSKVSKSAEALLKAAGLWDYFDFVICADHVKNPKPHPEMGLLVMQKLGVLPEHSIMVGDTTHDIFMANDSGMRSIAVSYGIHSIDKLNVAFTTWIAH
jgi:phosphoglycolate phosphatase